MDFILSDEHRLVRDTIREFARKEIEPIADDLDRSGRFPLEVFRSLGAMGYLGAAIPAEYGGAGLDLLGVVLMVEELARVCPPFAMDIMVHSGAIAYGAIYRQGTESQRRAYLPAMCRGDMIGAILQTEPNAGSDVAAMATRAVEDGDAYRVSGVKTFITNFAAPLPAVGCLLAVTEPGRGSRGMTDLIVEKAMPGVSIGTIWDKCGMRCSQTAEVIFQDVRVPRANVLGEPGRGMRAALSIIDYDRLMCIPLSVGLAQGVLDLALAYAQERRAFGQPIANFQAIQMKLADMATHVTMARLAAYYAAWTEMQGQPFTAEVAMGKLYASRIATEATMAAMQIHGGYGFMREGKVERFFRDVKAIELGGGSNEILQLVIARYLLRGGSLTANTPAAAPRR